MSGGAVSNTGMVDPTSDLAEDVAPEDAPRCARCDDPVVGPGRRVRSWIEDGRVERRHFCDEECLAAWDGREAVD